MAKERGLEKGTWRKVITCKPEFSKHLTLLLGTTGKAAHLERRNNFTAKSDLPMHEYQIGL